MSWLEKNQRILSEARTGLTWTLGQRTVSDRGTGFSPVGTFHSAEVGRVIHAGIKYTYNPLEFSFAVGDLSFRVAEELVVIDKIANALPHLNSALPLFEGLLVDEQDEVLAILTEDFSRGRRFKVQEHPYPPEDLVEFLMGERYQSSFQLQRIGFMVNKRLRLGDFDNMFHTSQERSKIFNIGRSMDLYTVRVARERVRQAFDD